MNRRALAATLTALAMGTSALAQMPAAAPSAPAVPPAAPAPATPAPPAPSGPFPGPAGQAPQPIMPIEVFRLDPRFDRLVAPEARPELLVTIEGMAGEGPLWQRGQLWVSDQRGGNIYAIDVRTGAHRTVSSGAGGKIDLSQRFNMGPNGHVPYLKGETLIMRQDVRDISILHADGSFTPWLTNYQGKRFNAPNDMVFAADGTLWFTDPTFSTPAPWRELPWAAVWRYRKGELTPVVTDMNLPNGIGLSPNGRRLYVDNSGPERYVRVYDVDAKGELSNGRLFAKLDMPGLRGGADGLKVDAQGNLWVTGPGGVSVFAPDGTRLGRIQLPQGISNLVFGGPDLKTVFFTSGASIYRLRALVKGQVPKYFIP
jgi:gluconolactonase